MTNPNKIKNSKKFQRMFMDGYEKRKFGRKLLDQGQDEINQALTYFLRWGISVEDYDKTPYTEKLSQREKDILTMRWRDNKILEDVGKEFDVTRERIRQIELKILAKLGLYIR